MDITLTTQEVRLITVLRELLKQEPHTNHHMVISLQKLEESHMIKTTKLIPKSLLGVNRQFYNALLELNKGTDGGQSLYLVQVDEGLLRVYKNQLRGGV